MPIADVGDLQARALRELTQVELDKGQTLLDDAYDIITQSVPSVPSRVGNNDFRRIVVRIQCAMVLRVMNNPLGKLEESQDDYSYRLDSATSTGELNLTDAEALLLQAGDSASDSAFTIRPFGVSRSSLGWVTPSSQG